ncbi:MAG: hypothetical protein ACWA5Q_06180 [bacterium]
MKDQLSGLIVGGLMCSMSGLAVAGLTPNGYPTDAPQKGAAETVVSAVEVPTNGQWLRFSFDGPGSFGTDNGDGPPPWTFEFGDEGGTLYVTDCFLNGDRFEIFDNNVSIGTTDVPANDTDSVSNADACYADPNYSQGAFELGPGAHSITIQAITSPHGSGGAFFRVQGPPAPVPTVGALGLGLLAGLLGVAAYRARRSS